MDILTLTVILASAALVLLLQLLIIKLFSGRAAYAKALRLTETSGGEASDKKTEPCFISEDEGRNWFYTDPKTHIKKQIVRDGRLTEKPELEHYDLVMRHYRESGIYDGEFGYGSYCCTGYCNRPMICWRIQPDGRYYSDDDGFGSEDQDEIELYVYLDGQGNYDGKFRIKCIGVNDYIGTDREDREARENEEREEKIRRERDKGKSFDEINRDMVRSALDFLCDPSNRNDSIVIPIAPTPYDAKLECREWSEGDISVYVTVFAVGSSSTYSKGAVKGANYEELVGLMKKKETVEEVVRIVNELERSARGIRW